MNVFLSFSYTYYGYICLKTKYLICVIMGRSTSKKIIGIMIKTKREEKKMTQTQLASLLDIDRQYMWRIENGEVNLTLDYLDKIILALNCNHDHFYTITT